MDKITSDVCRQQWLDIIQACNASGLTKKAWCEQNGINIKSFYYWQRQLRHETYDVQSAALSPEPEVTFAEIAVLSSPKKHCRSDDDGFGNKFLSGCCHSNRYLDNRSIESCIQRGTLTYPIGDEICYVIFPICKNLYCLWTHRSS